MWKFFNSSGAEIVAEASAGMPTGAVMPYAGSTAPEGWLMCDGATASTATYPDLYALIGTTYGATGSGYFTLPDLQGRVAVGKAGAGGHTDVTSLANNEGEALASRRPKHGHGTHYHDVPSNDSSAGGTGGPSGIPEFGKATQGAGTAASGVTENAQVGVTTAPTDAPAYLVLNYIIKT